MATFIQEPRVSNVMGKARDGGRAGRRLAKCNRNRRPAARSVDELATRLYAAAAGFALREPWQEARDWSADGARARQ
jgi:hypothetical protein